MSWRSTRFNVSFEESEVLELPHFEPVSMVVVVVAAWSTRAGNSVGQWMALVVAVVGFVVYSGGARQRRRTSPVFVDTKNSAFVF